MFLSIVICIYVLSLTWWRPFWKMAVFPGISANFGILPSRFLKLRVYHTQINGQTLCLQKLYGSVCRGQYYHRFFATFEIRPLSVCHCSYPTTTYMQFCQLYGWVGWGVCMYKVSPLSPRAMILTRYTCSVIEVTCSK